MQVTTIDELKERIRTLFDNPDLAFADYLDHGIAFDVPGKAKALMQQLQQTTGATHWSGEAGNLFYRCDDENWAVFLRSIPHTVFCIASVLSLHQRYLDRHRAEFERHQGSG